MRLCECASVRARACVRACVRARACMADQMHTLQRRRLRSRFTREAKSQRRWNELKKIATQMVN
eukprot:3457343-Pleurochrysis_carterae.AAC.1